MVALSHAAPNANAAQMLRLAGCDPVVCRNKKMWVSNLVLTFDYDAWEQIVSFPYDLDSVHRVRISERERTDEGTEVDEIVRVSKLVRTCKTFYNRYRVRNQQNWLEWKLHKNNEKDCLAERVENAERPRALCTVTWNEVSYLRTRSPSDLNETLAPPRI